jgi:hypothetical protein
MWQHLSTASNTSKFSVVGLAKQANQTFCSTCQVRKMTRFSAYHCVGFRMMHKELVDISVGSLIALSAQCTVAVGTDWQLIDSLQGPLETETKNTNRENN